jgi:hypothetical protein
VVERLLARTRSVWYLRTRARVVVGPQFNLGVCDSLRLVLQTVLICWLALPTPVRGQAKTASDGRARTVCFDKIAKQFVLQYEYRALDALGGDKDRSHG